MRSIRRIGVFDSGLGGLTVLRALLEAFPSASFVYLGDTARTPYGSKSSDVVVRYSLECAAFLEAQGIDLLVVACNTASSLALEQIQAAVRCPVVGTIEPALQAWAEHERFETLGIIGTAATIQSGAYQRLLDERFPNVPVIAVPCPLFVPFVEEGLVEGPLVDSVIRHYLADLRAKEVRSVILACTHYPLLRGAIEGFLGDTVLVIDSADSIARQISSTYNLTATSDRSRSFFVTDDVVRFRALARRFLGGDELVAEKVELFV